MDAVHHLSIDIETYSDVDISKAGLYKYARSPAFAILLLAYSLDGAPVQVIDLSNGGMQSCIPLWLIKALMDPAVIKHAYNAAFEWYCLCQYFRWNPMREGQNFLRQWRCTMLHSLYCGYPAGLDAAGKALGLPQDKQKLAAGRALIKYFCVPCTPTKANGGRTRNLPHHDPARWELFKTYNGQDVLTEMEIEHRLSGFPVPDEVQAQWVTDQIINLRGVAVDQALVEGVLEVFRTHGKIYEATASQMFGIPMDLIKKGNPEYSYRQKGKVATLALGYQGGTGSLISMGALRNGLNEEELPDIVERWRNANPAIVQFWYTVEAAAKEAVNTGRKIELWDGRLAFARECDPCNDLDFLTVRLPSNRKLYYVQPYMGTNRFGRPSLVYWGMNQKTKKWEQLETYGGKLAENITQAVARDCLAEAIERLEAAGYPVVFHIHDEVVIDAGPGKDKLEDVIKIMSQVPEWAHGLPLNADGWVNDFFKKD